MGCTKIPDDNDPQCSTSVGNPVDTRSGMKVEAVIDYAGERSLTFGRRYLSSANYWGGDDRMAGTRLGRGWRSEFDSSLFYVGGATAATRIYAVLPSGAGVVFQPASGSTTSFEQIQYNSTSDAWAVSSKGFSATLERRPTFSEYRLVTADDIQYYYDYNGRLTRIVRGNGYSQSLTYDTAGNNTAVTDSYGQVLTFAYSGAGLVTSMTVPGGKSYAFTYTRVGSPSGWVGASDDLTPREFWVLASVSRPDVDSNPSNDPKVTYHYEDTAHRYALTGITDERNVRYATWTYHADGRVATSAHAGGAEQYSFAYDDLNRRVTVTNPLGKQSVYHFQDDGQGRNRLVRLEGKSSSHCVADDTYITYDTNGFINQITDGEGRIKQFTNNARGLPTQTKEAASTGVERTTNVTWDSSRSLPSQIASPGRTVSFTYSAAPDGSGGGSGGGGHSYWRLRMLSNDVSSSSDPYIDIAEVEFRATAGGADQASGGSSFDSATGAHSNAFDNSTSTYWSAPSSSVFDSWFGYHFVTPVEVNQVSVQTANNYQPSDFIVESSDDGLTWNVEWYVLDVAWSSNTQAQTFDRVTTPDKTAPYPKWRLRFWRSTDGLGHNRINATEFEFRSAVGGADQTTGGTPIASGSNSCCAIANAFDNGIYTAWQSPSPAHVSWAGYHFATDKAIAEVGYKATEARANDNAPKDFAIQFFDGTRWWVARDIRNQINWSNFELRTWAVAP